jgi:dolichol kinase
MTVAAASEPAPGSGGAAPSEATRRGVHVASGLPAFLLPWLDWRLALGVAAYFLFLNAEVLPRTRWGRRILRGRSRDVGVILYPATVAALVVVFRADLLPAAAGWVALAFGDPAASWVGRTWGRRRWPWGGGKSVEGAVAFAVAALLPLALVHGEFRGLSATSFLFAALVGGVAAVLESLPFRLDDNPVVGFGAGGTAWLLLGTGLFGGVA